MDYLLLYLAAALGISLLHRFICRDGDRSQDDQIKANLGVGNLGFEALLIIVGAIWLPGTLYDICTWHRDEQ